MSATALTAIETLPKPRRCAVERPQQSFDPVGCAVGLRTSRVSHAAHAPVRHPMARPPALSKAAQAFVSTSASGARPDGPSPHAPSPHDPSRHAANRGVPNLDVPNPHGAHPNRGRRTIGREAHRTRADSKAAAAHNMPSHNRSDTASDRRRECNDADGEPGDKRRDGGGVRCNRNAPKRVPPQLLSRLPRE